MIENILVLSTAHITMPTNDLLAQWTPDDFQKDLHDDEERMPFRFVAHHYGYIIFLSDSSRTEEFMQRVLEHSVDLGMVIDYAIKHGCTMICFDRDAETTSDLPTFKW
jgi:hypothetical protein